MIDVAVRDNPLEIDTAIINIWLLIESEELEGIFAERKRELFTKYSLFKRNNGQLACILKKLLLMDDLMIELSISRGLLESLTLELRSPTIVHLVTTGIIDAIVSSRTIYLEAVLNHSTLWKAIKKILVKNRLSDIAPWLSSAILKSCLVATPKQIGFMIGEEVLPIAISIVSNIGDRTAKGFMRAVDVGIEKIAKTYKHNKDKRCIECIEMLKNITA